ncbi:uncharacterized protein [Ptychodera flava]|uniref:uncharacterized protein n=1 Tax=Ptychodera flava TaxID=63121 RepID=UPI00396A9430
MADITGIPVVDFSAYSLNRGSADNNEIENLIEGVNNALTSIGFLYLVNHGIPQSEIDNAFTKSRKFFELPKDVKMKYKRPDKSPSNHGYVECEREKLNPNRPGDLKECFNYGPKDATGKMPDEEVQDFTFCLVNFFDKCRQLSNRVLEVMARGLNLEDPYLFVKAHEGIGGPDNDSAMRLLYYPPVPENVDIDQVRCGEHSDYGSITLLFQDSQGGLEVQVKDGDFIPATPIDGAVVVNIGDLMQRWTSDRFVSNVHRVVLPKTEDAGRSPRQSIAFFHNSDNMYVVRCVDGSDKYPPIATSLYLQQKFSATYKY